MARESALFIVGHGTPVFGLGKIGPDSDLLLHTRESFSRSRKLRGHRPTVLFFHRVSRGARARDYQTAGVRDCCTRQMLSRHPNLLSRVPLLPLSLALLPLETSHPVRCSLFLRAIPSSSSSNNSSRGIDREIPNASCHPIDSSLPWQSYQDGNIYTLVVDIFFFLVFLTQIWWSKHDARLRSRMRILRVTAVGRGRVSEARVTWMARCSGILE